MLIPVPHYHAAVPEAQSSALLLTSPLSVIEIGPGAKVLWSLGPQIHPSIVTSCTDEFRVHKSQHALLHGLCGLDM